MSLLADYVVAMLNRIDKAGDDLPWTNCRIAVMNGMDVEEFKSGGLPLLWIIRAGLDGFRC